MERGTKTFTSYPELVSYVDRVDCRSHEMNKLSHRIHVEMGFENLKQVFNSGQASEFWDNLLAQVPEYLLKSIREYKTEEEVVV
jgi:hypothetical protein